MYTSQSRNLFLEWRHKCYRRSEIIETSLQRVLFADYQGAFGILWQTPVQIGCSFNYYNSYDAHCPLWFSLNSGGECPYQPTSMDHAVCGVKASAIPYWSTGNYFIQDHLYRNDNFPIVYNETGHSTQLYNTSIYGTKVLISDEPHDPGQMFKASFLPLTSDHALWNNYQIPELKVHLKPFENKLCDCYSNYVMKNSALFS